MTQTAAPSLSAVPRARIRPRHVMVAASFVVLVILPTILAGWYLWTRAADRYISRVGFSVRTEEIVAGETDLSRTTPLPEAPWNPPGVSYSVRRVLIHLVAETTQHAGHAEIIRESIDGRTSM